MNRLTLAAGTLLIGAGRSPMFYDRRRRAVRGGDEVAGRADRARRAQGVRRPLGRQAEPGTRYKNRLHKIDNLQSAAPNCNKRNTPKVAPDSEDGWSFVLPWEPSARSAR